MLSASFTPVLLFACSTLLLGANSHSIHTERSLQVRDDGQCGPGVGSCPSGSCCNKKGQCGTDHTFCGGAKNCQIDYSDNCEETRVPTGPSTTNITRTKIGKVPYGTMLKSCTKPGSIALAFDDGPAKNFTVKVLDLLKSYDMKATFFVTGHDFDQPIDNSSAPYAAIMKRALDEGHQIGSHTWTHENLTSINDTRITNQMIYNEMAIRNVLGFIPTYMRPPYLQCQEDCLKIMGDLGYHVVRANLDTKDFDNNSPDLIQISKDEFANWMKENQSDTSVALTLNHDIRVQTAYNLTDFMLNYMVTNNLPKSITVGECMDDPKENWYRDAGGPLMEIVTPASPTSANPSSTKAAKAHASSGTPNSASDFKYSHPEMLLYTVGAATFVTAMAIFAI